MINNNCQDNDCSIESLLLRSNKPFDFCTQDTHITFLIIYLNKRQVNMNLSFQIT